MVYLFYNNNRYFNLRSFGSRPMINRNSFFMAVAPPLSSRRHSAGLLVLVGLAIGVACGPPSAAFCQDESVPDRSALQERPQPLTEYMGREIAATMSYHGAPWLNRDTREGEERCSLLLANLGLKPGMVVCDLGCGNGYYTAPIAKLIPDGHVYAVDIQPEMLSLLREKLQADEITNVTPVLGLEYDPKLPDASVDLVLLVDVYHEFAYPEPMLAAIRRALKPDGRVVFVEFRAEDPDVPIKPEHKMTRAQVLKEITANGFRFHSEFEKLPWQHVLFFEIDESQIPTDD
jgi:SAM-dependent methyltransferase